MLRLIIMFSSIVSILYAIPYANYELKQNNKAGAITIYVIAACLFVTSIIKYLN